MRSKKKSRLIFLSFISHSIRKFNPDSFFFAVKRSSLQDLPLPPYMIYNNPPPGVAIHVIECGKKKTSNDVCSAVIERTADSAQLRQITKDKNRRKYKFGNKYRRRRDKGDPSRTTTLVRSSRVSQLFSLRNILCCVHIA
jgi:hypothetical protein